MLVACASLSCRSATGPTAGWVAEALPNLGPVVARVGQNAVFAREVLAQSARSHKAPREALEEIVTFHLLAERARERGHNRRITETTVPRELLVQRLIEREFEPSVEMDDLTDQELRGIYERTRAKYVHPRMVRVALLSVYPRRGMPKDVAKAKARETALALFEYVSKRADRTHEDFAQISKEEAWTARRVNFSRIWQGPDEDWGAMRAEEGAAIARLRRPGDTSPLLEDAGAYHIARYIEETPAKDLAFEKVREEIRSEHYPGWRRHRFERFVSGLTEKHRLEAFTDRVTGAPSP